MRIERIRDVTYDEGRSQIRTANGPQTMATLRDAALRLAGATNIATANRHHARNPHHRLSLLGITKLLCLDSRAGGSIHVPN